ncbi:alkaline phosphate [Penaeus vannamei]|uniref:alkaline phosphatase n=1 Tax=Penaeus vannamei TaxID=6689 RepID=A0A423SZ16_PENVA|nr:alkaline phosphate [Penaeus vannamei]
MSPYPPPDSLRPPFFFQPGIFGYSHLDFEVDRNKGPSGDPSLMEMTMKAIQILRKNPHGYFLMVEAGRIDHAHHHNNGRRALEEVCVMDDAIQAALNTTSPTDTLLVLTADHSHVFTFGGDNTPRGHPVTGFDRKLSDLDGKPYTTLLYGNGPGYAHATPTGRQDLTGFNTQDINFVQQAAVPRKYETHGGEDVPVYAYGPGAHLFSGTIEQTYIAHAIAHAACIAEDNNLAHGGRPEARPRPMGVECWLVAKVLASGRPSGEDRRPSGEASPTASFGRGLSLPPTASFAFLPHTASFGRGLRGPTASFGRGRPLGSPDSDT